MAADDEDIFERAIHKLGRLAELDEADRQAVRNLDVRIATIPANDLLVVDGDTPAHCCLLIDGYACRHKETSGGGRQILSFHLAGDLLGVQHALLPRADHNVQTISPATIARVPVTALRALVAERPRVSEALWCDTLIEGSIFREWVLNVGRRDAMARIAHMLCEFAARREAAGFGSPERFELPMTQEQIGDATGLTSVHVNRKLHELAAKGVIARDRRHVHIVDWQGLKQLADFDARYLHAAA
jgi:CRP-like cAMP-binding protein